MLNINVIVLNFYLVYMKARNFLNLPVFHVNFSKQNMQCTFKLNTVSKMAKEKQIKDDKGKISAEIVLSTNKNLHNYLV